jgi:hypothetical protein
VTNADLVFIDGWSEIDRLDEQYHSYVLAWPRLTFANPEKTKSKFLPTRSIVSDNFKGKNNVVLEAEFDGWKMISQRQAPRRGFEFEKLKAKRHPGKNVETILDEVFFESTVQPQGRRWLIDELWTDLFGDQQLLPFNLEQRKKQFPKAAKALSRFKVESNLNMR